MQVWPRKRYFRLILLAALVSVCTTAHGQTTAGAQPLGKVERKVEPALAVGSTILQYADANGVPTLAILPGSYDASKPFPWIIYDHGFGQTINAITAQPPQSTYVQALVAAGYVVIASEYRELDCWGDMECAEDIANLQTLWHSLLNLAPQPFVIGESMGGMVTWNAISHGTLQPLAVVGIYPACNLADMYTNLVFMPIIQSDYGFDSSQGYSTATAGFDPLLAPPDQFTSFPILMWSSYGDTVVVRSRNEDPFAAAINAAGGQVTIRSSVGDHGDLSNFDVDAVLMFFSSTPSTATIGTTGVSTATTGAAGEITAATASLSATANPNGLATQGSFQYGTDSALTGALLTPMQALGGGLAKVSFNAVLTGLSANTVYYYRAVASSNAGTSDGAIGTFTTSTVAGGGASPGALQFVAVSPCRIADTRNPAGPFGGPEPAAGSTTNFLIPQSNCKIPSTAVAYSLNATVVPNGPLSYLTLWPSGQPQPYVSTLNSDGRVKANAAIVPAGTNGGISVFVSDATQLIFDINGYFVPAGSAALAFYPVTPCRIADTRQAAGPLGGPSLGAGNSRSFPVLSGTCNLPSTAQAYSLTVTALPQTTLSYLTSWPTGEAQPYVSTLNSSTGAVTANAAIVAAGTSGEISIFVSDAADVILDVDGYFAPPTAEGLSLYTVTPCRVLDTRPNSFSGTTLFTVQGSVCAPPPTAQAYVLNATTVPQGVLDYLTLWPDGSAQPNVSALNAYDGAITSNMAIVPTTNGNVYAHAAGTTNLILDLSSYFAP